MAELHMEQWPAPVPAGRGSVLDAALDAGVPFPHGCMSGECGQCKCQLLAGQVERLSASPDALSAADVVAGRFLACRSRARGDVSLRWLAATPAVAVQKLDARVSRVELTAHDVLVLRLRPARPLPFVPGQFARLSFAGLPARSYSMAGQPTDAELEFHVRVLPQGRVSAQLAQRLKPGDRVHVEGPFGDAHWRDAGDAPLVLLAGGTGLAPMLSVLGAALAAGHAPGRIHLYHGVREARDLYAGARLRQQADAQGFRFCPLLAADDELPHRALARDFASLADAHVYVAGPPPMVDAVREAALARGADPARVYADAFHPAPPESERGWRAWLSRLVGGRRVAPQSSS